MLTKKLIAACAVCKNKFTKKKRRQKFCSTECANVGKKKRVNIGVAYTIKRKNIPGEKFSVKKTDNGWWREKLKVLKLMDAYAIGATNKEACFWAGISKKQYENFTNIHPDFKEARDLLKTLPITMARITVIKALASNPDIAFDYLVSRGKL